jgi:hypothetical protein
MFKSFPIDLMDPPRSTALIATLRASSIYKLVCLCLRRIAGCGTCASGVGIRSARVGNTCGVTPCGQSPSCVEASLAGLDSTAVHPLPLHATIHSAFPHSCLHSRCCINTYSPQSIYEFFQPNSNWHGT